jgi:hypothetical protein
MRAAAISIPRARQWHRFCRRGRHWAVLFLLVWIPLFAFLFRLRPGLPPSSSTLPPPHIRHVNTSFLAADGPLADIRNWRSPAIYGLATPVGFTHALQGIPSPAIPPLATPADSPAEGDSTPIPSLPPSEPLSIIYPVPVPSILPSFNPPAETPPPTTPSSGTATLLRFAPETWSLADIPAAEALLEAIPAWTNTPWNATVSLRFDGQGLPAAVFLETPSDDSAIDARLVAALHAWRLPSPSLPRESTVAFFFAPPPAP